MIRLYPSRNHRGLNVFNSVRIVDLCESKRPHGRKHGVLPFAGIEARTEAVARAEAFQTCAVMCAASAISR